MAGSRWIKISVILTLLLLLLLPHVSAADQSQLVENGSTITLSCKNPIDNQNECNATTWIFTSARGQTTELIKLGQIGKEAGNRSHALHVLRNCSLRVKNVAAEDAGLYTCRQYSSDAKSGGTPIQLSVVTMTEETSNDLATLKCSVDTYERCRFKVDLLFGDTDEQKNLKKPTYSCCVSLQLPVYDFKYKDRFNTLKCKVKDGEAVQDFVFRSQPSVRNTKTTTQSTTTTPTELTAAPDNDTGSWWLFVVGVVILAALFITCVTVLLCKRKKGNKTQTTENANHEDGVFYTSISFTRVGKGRVLGKNAESESEAVTYSTVKSSSMDPSHVYASVNSPS